MDARHDRVAHAGVDPRAGQLVLALADLRELGLQENRVVRLVPGDPEPDGRQSGHVGGRMEAAAVALCGGEGEVPKVDVPSRGLVLRRACPGRRPQDREDGLDLVVGRLLDHRVVDRPVVGGIVRIERVRWALLARDAARTAPVEVDPERLDAEQLVLVERPGRVADGRLLVEDAHDQAPRLRARLGGGRDQAGDDREADREERDEDERLTHRLAPSSAASGAGLPRDRSRAPSRAPALRV